ncbi:LysR family transcriptional regulator [Sphingomonas koreensis]|nr:LysR family transcriptional regulator [Sphingomonas koreensis]
MPCLAGMNMDRIDRLRSFVRTADLGSFTAAAKSFRVTQSTVSKHVAAIERDVGAALFRRTTRSLVLTEAGATLIDPARAAIAAVEALERPLGDVDPLAGRIRLTAPPNLFLARMMPMLAAFRAAWPQVAIDARLHDDRVDLAREEIDLAVRVGALGAAQGRRIGTARRILVAAPDYLARAGTPRAPADLADHQCLSYALLESGGSWRFEDGSVVSVSGGFSANDPSALRLAALAGMGIVQSAAWMFEGDLASGALIRVLPDTAPPDMPIHLVLRSGAPPAPRIGLFADFLAEHFARDALLAP